MSNKIKSLLYFSSLVVSLIAYSHMNNVDTIDNTEMAENTTVQVSTPEALN